MLRMRIVAVCSQLQMCFRFSDPSAVVSARAVTVGLVWYGLSALIPVSFIFIYIIQPGYFLDYMPVYSIVYYMPVKHIII